MKERAQRPGCREQRPESNAPVFQRIHGIRYAILQEDEADAARIKKTKTLALISDSVQGYYGDTISITAEEPENKVLRIPENIQIIEHKHSGKQMLPLFIYRIQCKRSDNMRLRTMTH